MKKSYYTTQKSWYQSKFFSLLCSLYFVLALPGCSKQADKQEKAQEEQKSMDLEQRAYMQLKNNQLEDAASTIESVIAKNPNSEKLHTFKLLLANTYFKLKKYKLSSTLFEHYHRQYPSDKNAEFAKYHAVLSLFYQTLRPDCDQTKTKETLAACKEYIDFKSHNKYRKDVIDIEKTCKQRLIDKEVYVYNFYLKQKEYAAAKKRLEGIRKEHLAENKDLAPRLLYLECKLAHKQKQKKELVEHLEKLASDYPESQFTSMAKSMVTQKSFVF